MDDESNFEGWKDNTSDETVTTFSMRLPKHNGDVYFTAESYYGGTVPENCFEEYGVPLLQVVLRQDGATVDY
jgi:hypothetical protein